MTAFLTAVNKLFDLLFWPFQFLPPLWLLLASSVLTGFLLAWVYRVASDQKALRRAKDRLQAHVLEVRLFQDQMGVVLRAYPRILAATGSYLRHSLRPLLVMLLPLVLLLAQLELRLGHRPAHVGESLLIAAHFSHADAMNEASLRLPDGLALTAPPLHIPGQGEMDWRIRTARPGTYVAEILVEQQAFAKEIIVGGNLPRVSPLRPAASWWRQLLYPGEPPVSSSALREIEVLYERRLLPFGFFEAEWLIPFFVLSLVAGYAVKGVVKAEF